MTNSRAVLFDLDGTLCDRDAAWKAYLASLHARICSSSVAFEVFQARALELEEEFRTDRPRLFSNLQAEFEIQASAEELLGDFRSRIAEFAPLFPDATEVLSELRSRNLKLGIVTNGSVQAQEAKIKATGLDKFFDAVLISEREGVRKPEREIFERAASCLELKPQECLFVGDDLQADVVAAQNAKMRAVWACREGQLPALENARPDGIISHLADLLALI